MSQDLNTIIALLHKTFTSKTSEDIKEAESELSKFSSNLELYILNLVQIISVRNDINLQIKSSASIRLKMIIKEALEQNSVPYETNKFLIQSVFSSIVAPSINTSIRNTLEDALALLFARDYSISSGTFFGNISQYLISSLQSDFSFKVGAIKTIEAMIVGINHTAQCRIFLRDFIGPLIDLGNHTINSLRSLPRGNSLLEESLEILYELSLAFLKIIVQFEFETQEYKNLADLASYFKDCLLLEYPNSDSHKLITIGKSKSQDFFNSMKSLTLQAVYNVVSITTYNDIKSLAKSDINQQPFSLIIFEFYEPLLYTIFLIISHTNYEFATQQESISDLISHFLKLLVETLRDDSFYHIHYQNYQHIIVDILFPLLKTTENEKEGFELNPEDFIEMSNDICSKKKSQTPKSLSAELLLKFSKKIDGALTFITNFLVDYIDFAILNASPLSFSSLENFSSSVIMTFTNEAKLDLGLLCLSALSYYLIQRPDLLEIIDSLLLTHIDTIMNYDSNLVINRFCLFFNYFGSELLKTNSDLYQKIVAFIVSLCDPEQKHKGVHNQASNTISTLISDSSSALRINSFIDEIFLLFISYIGKHENLGFFDALKIIIENKPNVALTNIDKLIPELVDKILNFDDQIDQRPSIKSDCKMLIKIICWKIMQAIVESPHVSVEVCLDIEKQLQPLIDAIKDGKEDYEEYLFDIENEIIKKCENVTNNCWTIFDFILGKKEAEDTFYEAFPFINNTLWYGREVIKANLNIISRLVDISGKFLQQTPDEDGRTESQISRGALILQQILHVYTGYVDEDLEKIILYVMQRLMLPIGNELFKMRLLGVIFSGFMYNCQKTLEILSSRLNQNGENLLELFLNDSLNIKGKYSHPYDRRIAVIGFTQLMLQEELPEIVTNNISQIFKLIVYILYCANPPQDVQEMPMSHDIDEIVNKMMTDESIEFLYTYSFFNSPIKDIDEYDHFRNLLKTLKSVSNEALQMLVGELDKDQVEQLFRVIESKKVQINSKTKGAVDVRKIVKPKKTAVSN
ncbi:unnamed protein product [Blepharisma stoltei]|uniref:Uncharacterized protein n=1 Tax=Blepharisma stoltei TaxID=1481888 RepID=A0AAU9JQT6_9CILI|nr:unnamed protein product [Blepharisma stoltei]